MVLAILFAILAILLAILNHSSLISRLTHMDWTRAKTEVRARVNAALELDAGGQSLEAITAYTSALTHIMAYVADAPRAVSSTPPDSPPRTAILTLVQSFLKLAQQCLERSQDLALPTLASLPHTPQPHSPHPTLSLPLPSTTSPNSSSPSLSPVSAPTTPTPQTIGADGLTERERQVVMLPVLKAQAHNTAMMQRLMRRQAAGGGAAGERQLQLMRKAEENMAIARRKQELIRNVVLNRRKQAESEARAQADASIPNQMQMFFGENHPQWQAFLHWQAFQKWKAEHGPDAQGGPSQDPSIVGPGGTGPNGGSGQGAGPGAGPGGLGGSTKPTPLEPGSEFASPLASPVSMEDASNNPYVEKDKEWCARLASGDSSADGSVLAIHSYLSEILRAHDHPLGKMIAEFGVQFSSKYGPDAPAETIPEPSAIAATVQSFLSQFCEMIVGAYPEIETIPCGVDQVQLTVEEVFFPEVYQPLFSVYVSATSDRDSQFTQKTESFRLLPPSAFNIPPRFWLVTGNDDDDDAVRAGFLQSYADVIELFQGVGTAQSPGEKLACLVEVSQAICDAVESYYADHPEIEIDSAKLAVGAEDLLPLFSYCLLQANTPYIWAHNAFLTDHINNFFCMGEQGYALATTQTSLEYLDALEI